MSFQKREISLRYWLQGGQYFKALHALEWAKRYHTGVRKDGVTPEIDHQISIAHYVRTLHTSLLHVEDTLITVLLHDVREDYGVSDQEVEREFGTRVARAVDAVTKTFRGEKRDAQTLFDRMAQDPIASVVKGADRIHNLNSMVGVFSPEKQQAYVQEAEQFFFPMLKQARRLHPQQEPVYENLKHMMRSQVALIKAMHAPG
jgi:(p)ppGpp synthase/HD superfamily hydrolase